MIKILGLVLVIAGAISLLLGIFGVFGSVDIGLSPWALIIIGIIFLPSGTGLLKHRKDTDQT